MEREPDPKFADATVWGAYDPSSGQRTASRGEANRFSKYTTDQIREIKQELANGKKPKALTELFGMSEAYIRDIRAGRVWSHVKLDS